ncbi:MAG: DUF2635 domain-containing protein [Proteobacteria bacterium]|nr:DUF2635 domain-containing protein [Pseudomonadota bacterium]
MSNKSIMIKPKEGLKVFNPATKLHIKESGELIVMSTYWQRRFNDNEIELVKKEVKKKIENKKSIMEGK